jgi:GNAT superfamily N-acetyltransferase
MISRPCRFCGEQLDADDLDDFGHVGLLHLRVSHSEMPFPDMAVRNYFEAEARMTGGAERLDEIGEVEIHPVTEDRIDDWLAFFDADAMVDVPQNAACYCLEPHELRPGEVSMPAEHWRTRRARAVERLRAGTMGGYLAYVDGRPAAWVNASCRADERLFCTGDPADADTIGVACFAVAPPYRRHGLSRRLLDRVVADAGQRGAAAVEAWPFSSEAGDGLAAGPGAPDAQFRGHRALFDAAGFTEIEPRQIDVVVRRPVS